jgi:hypothetical protein
VGDSLRDDYDGARAAGLRALLLDRNGQHREIPDRIASLAEIPELLHAAGERAEDRAERSEGRLSGKDASKEAAIKP